MCRLIALTSEEPLSPMIALRALDVMREGHDGSGVGLLLRDLGGPFENMKNAPILSGIFSEKGLKRLESFMTEIGFMTKYRMSFKPPETLPAGVPRRDEYLVRAYDYPEEWKNLSASELHSRLLIIRLELQKMGEKDGDIIVFSFWPDTIMIKETEDPLELAEHLNIDSMEIGARVIMAQGRQNTNYQINLYACHPFFLKGFSTMTNGENTAFIPIREYLMSRGFPGYTGYHSDSEVFTHILHYTISKLGLGLEVYKHIITPLQGKNLENHLDSEFLKHLKHSCRKLIIDGPNCVIGCLPDHSLFMAQDRKKLRPGVVGGKRGLFCFSSEICGLDSTIPDRDKSKDFQPMHLDTAVVGPDRKEVTICRQTQRLHLPH